MLSNFNMFEQNESCKKYVIGPFIKSEAQKIIIIIFFVKFTKDGNFPLLLSLLQSFMYFNKCKNLDIYFTFDHRVYFIPGIDLCYFYIDLNTSHCIVGTLVMQYLFYSIYSMKFYLG